MKTGLPASRRNSFLQRHSFYAKLLHSITIMLVCFSAIKVQAQTISSVTITAQSTPIIYGTSSTVNYTVTMVRSSGSGSYNMSISGLPAGVSFSWAPNPVPSPSGSSGSPVSATLSLTTNTLINAVSSPYIFSVTATGSNSTSVNGSLVISKKNLTITGLIANNKVYDQNTSATLNMGSVAISGVINGDAVSLNSGSVTGIFSDKNVGTGKTVTAAGFTISGTGVGNYNLIQPTTTANITQASLIPSFTANNKVYDGLIAATISSRSVSGVFSGDNITITAGTATFSDKNVGTGKTVTASGFTLGGTDAGNYVFSPTTATTTANITAAALTVTANPQSKSYGTLFNFAGTEFSSIGLQNGETVGTVSLSSTGAPALAAVGTYSITGTSATAGTFTASNYTITYVNGTMTVTKPVLTITASNQSKTYGSTFTFAGTEFTSTGLQNGETIGSVTLASGGAAATAGVSTYSIVPSAATGGTFNPANYTIIYSNGTMTVSKANLDITANDQSKTFGATFTFTGGMFTSSGLQNGETIGSVSFSSTGAAAGANVGTFAIAPSAAIGGTFNINNYNVSYVNGTLTVGAAPLTITANNVSKTYGATLTGGSGSAAFTSSGLTYGNTLTSVTIAYGTGAAATANVGTYNGSVMASSPVGANGFLASNYTIIYTAGNITVNAAALILTASNQIKTYGSVFSFVGTEFTTSGTVNGETVGSVTLSSTGSPAIAGFGTYPILISAATGGTFTASNYAITYTTGTLTVNKANLTLTANNQSKTFGATFSFAGTEFTPTGLQNGETIGSTTISSTGAVNTAAVGTYSIAISAATGGTFTATNYTITYTAGTLTVGAAPLIITANLVNKTYGTLITGGAGSTAFTPTGLVNGNTIGSVTIAYGTGAAANAAVGTYTGSVTASSPVGANGFVASNYSITYIAGNIIVNAATLTITASNQSKTYGTTFTFAGSEFSSSSLQNSETIGNVSLSSTGGPSAAGVGTYPIIGTSATGGTFNVSNYSITYVNGTMTISKANTTTSVVASATPVCFGTNITLIATVSPSAITGSIQFFDGAVSLGTVAISGGVATLNLSSLSVGSHATIRATYNGDANYNVSTSSNITVDVNATSVGGSVASNQTICQGSQPTSNLTLSGHTGSIVKWQRSADIAFTSPTDINNTSTSLTAAAIGVLNTTTYFRAVVQSGVCAAVNSSSVVITVDPTTVGGSIPNQTICTGSTPADLALGGQTGSVILKWQKSTDPLFPNGVSTNDIAFTGTTLPGTTIGALSSVLYIRAQVQSGVCGAVFSNYATIFIDAATISGSVSGTANVCTGNNSGMLILSGNNGVVVRWESSTDVGSSWIPITNTTNNQTYSNLTLTTQYRAVVRNGVCGSANVMPPAILTVRPYPTATISGTTTICQNVASPSITFTGANGTAPYTFTYKINAGVNQTVTTSGGNSFVTVSVPTGTSGTFTYSLVSVQGTYCGQAQTGSATVTVNPIPAVIKPSSQVVCNGTMTTAVNFAGTATSYTWTNTNTAIGLANGGNGDIGAFIATNSTTSPISGTVTVTPIYTVNSVSCNGPAETFTITVRPTPTATISGTASVCLNGTAPAITFTNPQSLPITITYNINNGSSLTIPVAASTTATVTAPTGTVGSFNYNLVSVAYQDVAPSCSNIITGTATVTVRPIPTATISGTITVCQNASLPAITFTNPQSFPITITYNINGAGITTIPVAANTTATVTAPTATPGTFNYNLVSVVYQTAPTCVNTISGIATVSVTATVGVPATPTASNAIICQGSANTTYTTSATNATSYNWSVTGPGNTISGTGTTGTVTWGAAFSGTATISVTANGCNGPSASASTTVTVRPTPVATISGNTTVCQSGTAPTITFTNPQSLPETITYNINGGSSFTINVAANSAATVTAPTGTAGTFNYNLVSVVYQDGAPSCSSTVSGTATITVNPLPAAFTGPNQSIIRGSVTQIGAAPVGSNTYSWSSNPAGFSSTVAGPHNVTPIVHTTYTLTETNPATGCYRTNSVIVTVKDSLVITKSIISALPSKPGDSLVYQLSYRNANPPGVTASDVVIVDYLPTENVYTYTSSTAAGTFNNGARTITWSSTQIPILASLPSDGVTRNIIVRGVVGRIGTAFSYNATTYYDSLGANTKLISNNIAIQNPSLAGPVMGLPANVTVQQFCGASIPDSLKGNIKSNTPMEIYYNITLTNSGNIADSFALSFNKISGKDMGVRFLNSSGNVISGTPWLLPGQSFTIVVEIKNGPGINPGDDMVYAIRANSRVCGTVNTTIISTRAYANNPPNEVDLRITKIADSTSIAVGNTMIYTISVTNTFAFAAKDITIIDTLPSTLSYGSLISASAGVSYTYNPVSRRIYATQSSLDNNDPPIVIKFSVTPQCTAVPSVTNKALVTNLIADVDTTSNTSISTTIVRSNINSPAVNPNPVDICAGQSVTMTATGALTGHDYKWYSAATGGTLLSTSNPFTPSPSPTSTTTYYAAIYKTGDPVCESSRAAVVVNVLTAPVITAQPTSKTICQGSNTNFSMTATGTSLSYQWQVSFNSGANWFNLSNTAPYSDVNTGTLVITNASFSLDNYQYRVVVSNSSCSPATSGPVILTVNPTPVATISGSNSVCSGTTNTYTATVSPVGGTVTHLWSVVSGLATISGSSIGSSVNVITPVVCSISTFTIRDNISRNGCTNSSDYIITVSPPPVATFTNLPGDMTVSCGAIPATSLLNYNNSGSGTCQISGSIMSTQTTAPGVCGGTVTETWTFTDACSRTITHSRTITVNPAALPTLTAPANLTVACGGIPVSSTISFTNGLTGGCLINGTSNASTFSAAPDPITGGTITETWTATDACSRPLASVSRTITVNPAPVFGTPVNATDFCVGVGSTGTLSVPSMGGVSYLWQMSTDNGSTWNNVPNAAPYSGVTSNLLTITNAPVILSTYLYRVSGTGTCINPQPSAVTAIRFKNVWVGNSNTNWSTSSNWSDNTLPSVSCPDVYIQGARPNQPTLSSGVATITNLIIQTGGVVTVTTGELQIAGTIINSGVLDLTKGKLTLNGTSTQTIAGSVFKDSTLKDLAISNNVTIASTLNNRLNITDALTFGSNAATLNSGGNLVLKSSASRTARVGAQAVGNVITGDVTVERYLLNARKWRLLAAPTNKDTQSIKSSWLENGVTPGPSGYGFLAADTRTDFAQRGFDVKGTNSSVKLYSAATDTWDAIDNVTSPIKSQQGYMVFVPGDRNVVFPNSGQTILRTKGALYSQWNIGPITLPAAQFKVIGNPFASPIDMKKVSKTNMDEAYYVWDPRLGGAYSLGGFVTFIYDGLNYINILPTPTYPGPGPYNIIESGMAFIVRSNSGGSIGFTEAAKSDTQSATITMFTSGARQRLRVNLNVLYQGNYLLQDGVMADFDAAYSNAVDGNDIRKMQNTGESVSWKTAQQLLVMERRAEPTANDTLHIQLDRVKAQSYQWEIQPENMDYPGRTAFLVDRYLNTSTPIEMDRPTIFNFTVVNVPGSYANDRFKIVFQQMKVLPVTFTSVKASRNADRSIAVQWKVENEVNIDQYEVQRSADGARFSGIITKAAAGNNGASVVYQENDLSPLGADNFYRVKALGKDGKEQYSEIVKVNSGKAPAVVSVFPNPVVDKTVQVQLKQVEAGAAYQLQLFSLDGKLQFSSSFSPAAGTSTQAIKLDQNVATGSYRIILTDKAGKQTDIPVVIQ